MRLRGFWVGSFCVAWMLGAGCASGPRPEPLLWHPVPGNAGQPPSINARLLILRGQPIRSAAAYSAPVDIDCEVELLRATADQAVFELRLVPKEGEPVVVRVAWDQAPLRLVAGQSYVIHVAVAPKLQVTVNGLQLPQATLQLPPGPFQLELAGAPASSQWQLRRCIVR